MDAFNALIFVTAVHALTLVVALFVVVVIVALRRITADRPKAAIAEPSSPRREDATA